jgi:hypothetical protein
MGEQDDRFLGMIDAAAGQAGLIVGNERDHIRAWYVGGRDNGEFVPGVARVKPYVANDASGSVTTDRHATQHAGEARSST